ncbi:phosphopantetheine-binding protein [Streptomyces sp. NPDC001848]|uniref:phosphopantetheine-binding protein n=1 Tax=Streptomyces sp. NPDC001848 TaxID=3364618 RepID=UPI003675B4E4
MDTVAGIWRDVLEISEVGFDDNFFDLGGHSLLLQMVQSGIAERTGKEIALIDLFNHPTVRSLAHFLDSDGNGAGSGGARGGRRTGGRGNRLAGRRARLGGNDSQPRGEFGD